jgi:hypothetical protein
VLQISVSVVTRTMISVLTLVVESKPGLFPLLRHAHQHIYCATQSVLVAFPKRLVHVSEEVGTAHSAISIAHIPVPVPKSSIRGPSS